MTENNLEKITGDMARERNEKNLDEYLETWLEEQVQSK